MPSLADLPNIVSYVFISAFVVAALSAVAVILPSGSTTSLAVADAASCSPPQCAYHTLLSCSGASLVENISRCDAAGCSTQSQRIVRHCTNACVTKLGAPPQCL